MAKVAGRKRRLTSQDGPRDLNITNLNRSASASSLCGNPARGLGGSLIEGQYSALKVLLKRLRESLFQLTPPPAYGQDLQAQTDLENGD